MKNITSNEKEGFSRNDRMRHEIRFEIRVPNGSHANTLVLTFLFIYTLPSSSRYGKLINPGYVTAPIIAHISVRSD